MTDPHPTQIFLHNPRALRIEYLLNESVLKLWWSPRAGESFDYRDRNFSSRDDYLSVFENITVDGLKLANFATCEYDPYHCVVRYTQQRLHLATVPDQPLLLIWGEQPCSVSFKTARYDTPLSREESVLAVAHPDAAYAFEFAAVLGLGEGEFQHTPKEMLEDREGFYARAEMGAGQVLVIGAGIAGEGILEAVKAVAGERPKAVLAATDAALVPHEASGAWVARENASMTALRRKTLRCLHSMIDDSGALRASIKAIYYLIWIRDGAFCFGYQEAAGWPHKLAAWCRLLMENRLEINEPGLPAGKVFAQLINCKRGKLEEDGIYYAVWSAFTHWTQTGTPEFLSGDNLAILEESMAWIEDYIFDAERGLFGSYFADESAMMGARDDGWDYAIGAPGGKGNIQHEGEAVLRCYDIYINILMHAAWSMLAAATEGEKAAAYAEKAERLWEKLAPFFEHLGEDIPPYGELLLESGRRSICPAYGPARSVYVWALSLPSFVPLPGIDRIRRRLLEDLMANPGGHWVNGICSVIASIDTWVCPESELVEALEMIARQAQSPGPYLPMGGAIQEKYDAPQGNLFHDIRPQAFAQSSWLAACANLGVRRLPFGLAVRSTRYYSKLTGYHWQGKTLDFRFHSPSGRPQIRINGEAVAHTLQLPEAALKPGTNDIVLDEGGACPLLVRSTIGLRAVDVAEGQVRYHAQAYGSSEMVFAEKPEEITLTDAEAKAVNWTLETHQSLHFLRFQSRGACVVACARG